eukprot:NODE_1571_length_1110_cov_102.239810.p2 GENE.NODE_1571_length_1110_cov_102.239810~~NODE_1571_length_1110_cov_102.239810.p2  ORF type:complete len:101 (-),score=14.54 NODE_1571_length_1110_cov_102.239810:465-767(-)
MASAIVAGECYYLGDILLIQLKVQPAHGLLEAAEAKPSAIGSNVLPDAEDQMDLVLLLGVGASVFASSTARSAIWFVGSRFDELDELVGVSDEHHASKAS